MVAQLQTKQKNWLDADDIPVESLPDRLTTAPQLFIWFNSSQAVKRYRRKLYRLNQNNARYRFRTLLDDNILIVFRLD